MEEKVTAMSESIHKLLQRRAIALFIERCLLLASILQRAKIDFAFEEGDPILSIDAATTEDGSTLWAEGDMLAAAAARFNTSFDGEYFAYKCCETGFCFIGPY